MPDTLRFPPIARDAWGLDPDVAMLNHGSFGACPISVLERQSELRSQLERGPVDFLMRRVQPLLDESRRALAKVVGAAAENLVFVANATAGVNCVLRSLDFAPGDEIVIADHGYNACNNVARYVAERSGAKAVVAEIPVPVTSPDDVVEAVLSRVTKRTRIVMLDHVTSPTAIVLPVEQVIARLTALGIDSFIDGAHAPGMVPLDIERLGPTYYTGNCHKWLCAPKGAGFLYVRPDRQPGIQPTIVSHGYNQPRPGYNRFQDAFDWPGTADPSAWICVQDAIRFVEGLMPGGLPALMERNRQLATAARRLLCARFGVEGFCPESMLGSIAAVRLSDDPAGGPEPTTQLRLFREHRIEVPVYYFPKSPRRVLRVSAQAYNDLAQYERLCDALAAVLADEKH